MIIFERFFLSSVFSEYSLLDFLYAFVKKNIPHAQNLLICENHMSTRLPHRQSALRMLCHSLINMLNGDATIIHFPPPHLPPTANIVLSTRILLTFKARYIYMIILVCMLTHIRCAGKWHTLSQCQCLVKYVLCEYNIQYMKSAISYILVYTLCA